MLHILLTILKVIGIILLIIVGLIVLIALCILFVPIRYKADISYDKKLSITAKATYLLHMITLTYEREDDSGLCLRIFGIKTGFLNKDKKEKNKKYDEETEMFEEMSADLRENNEFPDKLKDLAGINRKRDEEVKKSDNDDNYSETGKKNEDGDNNTDSNSQADNDEETGKISFIHRIIKNIKGIINKIKYRFKKFCGTIKKVCKNAKDFKDFITDEGTKEAFHFVKRELIVLLKHIRPRKIKGYIHYGFEDPSVTGKVLGIIYMLSSGTHKNFQINADFEDKVLEGEVHFRGYIQVYVLLIIAWRLYKNENLKEVLERRRTYGRE